MGRFTFLRLRIHTAKSATSTLSIRLLNTRLVKLPWDLKVDLLSKWNNELGKRRYDAKQKGFGGQTKPIFHKKVFDMYLI